VVHSKITDANQETPLTLFNLAEFIRIKPLSALAKIFTRDL
jgi:hypothetical protein